MDITSGNNSGIPMQLSLPQIFKLPNSVYEELSNKFDRVINMPALDYQHMLSSTYRVIHSSDFNDIYINIVKAVLDQLFISPNKVLIQKRPTARIQLSSYTSVPFHIDKWSGHPEQMLNIWIPLTPVYETTSLHLISKELSRELILKVERGELSLVDLSIKAARLATPTIVPPGSFLTFSNAFLHGTIPSIEPQPRFSLDFRIALDLQSLGNKKRNIDYSSYFELASPTIATNEAHSVVYSAHTFKNLGHSSQRAAINDFATQNKLRIISEASEFIGCKNTPQIEEYLVTSKSRSVICFSVNCFSSDQIERLKEFPREQQNSLFFALESICLSEIVDKNN